MMVEKNVKSSEVLEISGHEAVYLERNPADTDNIWFDKMLYVVYPETWKILFVYGGTDISKEELLKVVENTELQPTGETYSFKDAYTWSDMIEVEKMYLRMSLNLLQQQQK